MADLETARAHIKDLLTPARHQHGKYICPLCGSGTGSKGTAAFSIDKDSIHGHCFSCGFHGDIFDLVAQRDGISNADAIKLVTETYGGGAEYKPVPRKPIAAPESVIRKDFSLYLEQCRAELPNSEGEKYMHGRGFTDETLQRFGIGYDKAKQQIIMPYSRAGNYYIGRDITATKSESGEDRRYRKPRSDEAGQEPIYNAAALYNSEIVFVTEGTMDALSIMQAGGSAVALGGTGCNKFVRQLEEKPSSAMILLSLDNDKHGQEAEAAIIDALEAIHMTAYKVDVCAGCKDPNEALMHDAAALAQAVASTVSIAQEAIKATENRAAEEYQSTFTAGMMDNLLAEINDSKDTQEIRTGYPGLDGALDGGLRKGLYIIGAVSSLGKTAFVLQMADQIAASGQDVLMFNLEMATTELIARSISRFTYDAAIDQRMDTGLAKTTTGVLAGWRYGGYSQAERDLIQQAMRKYRATVGQHMRAIEGIGNISYKQIAEAIEQHIKLRGTKPVVIVDYLQIVAAAPEDKNQTDKQRTDKAVLEFKRMSRDYGLPFICISSFNRDNYNAPVNMAAFKESGGIEYGCDVLMGLQIKGLDYDAGEKEADRQRRVRDVLKAYEDNSAAGKPVDIQVKILKNRNGRRCSLYFTFAAPFNCFVDCESVRALADFSMSDEDNPFIGKAVRM